MKNLQQSFHWTGDWLADLLAFTILLPLPPSLPRFSHIYWSLFSWCCLRRSDFHFSYNHIKFQTSDVFCECLIVSCIFLLAIIESLFTSVSSHDDEGKQKMAWSILCLRHQRLLFTSVSSHLMLAVIRHHFYLI